MAIVLMPILIVFAVIKVIGPHDGYRAGDARSEPGFWLAVGLAFSIVWVTILIGSIRELRRTDSNDLPER